MATQNLKILCEKINQNHGYYYRKKKTLRHLIYGHKNNYSNEII